MVSVSDPYVNARESVDNAKVLSGASPPTLRDRFAMAALTGLLASPEPSWRIVPSQQEIISKSYELADAMLVARASILE